MGAGVGFTAEFTVIAERATLLQIRMNPLLSVEFLYLAHFIVGNNKNLFLTMEENMREIVQTIKVYKITELGKNAQQKALYDLRENLDFHFNEDWLDSIGEFCAFFRVKLLDYRVGDYSVTSYKTSELENRNFRGKKLKDFDPNFMPTGFCGDCPLWSTFYEVFKSTGDAKHAFKTALDAGFEAWEQDYVDYYSDESIIEHAMFNDYEFTENGKFYI